MDARMRWLFVVVLFLTLVSGVHAVSFPITENIFNVPDSTSSSGNWFGYEITTNTSNMMIANVTLSGLASPEYIAVFNSSGYAICKWLNTTVDANCSLPYVGVYYVMAGSDGTAYDFSYLGGGTPFPVLGEVMEYTLSQQAALGSVVLGQQYAMGSDATTSVNIIAITFDAVSTLNGSVSPSGEQLYVPWYDSVFNVTWNVTGQKLYTISSPLLGAPVQYSSAVVKYIALDDGTENVTIARNLTDVHIGNMQICGGYVCQIGLVPQVDASYPMVIRLKDVQGLNFQMWFHSGNGGAQDNFQIFRNPIGVEHFGYTQSNGTYIEFFSDLLSGSDNVTIVLVNETYAKVYDRSGVLRFDGVLGTSLGVHEVYVDSPLGAQTSELGAYDEYGLPVQVTVKGNIVDGIIHAEMYDGDVTRELDGFPFNVTIIFPLNFVDAKSNSSILDFCVVNDAHALTYCTTDGSVYIDDVNRHYDFAVRDANGTYYNVTAMFRQEGFEDNSTLSEWHIGQGGGSYNTTTERVFDGVQSLKVVSGNDGIAMARLSLDQMVSGKIVTGYMYDFGVGVENSTQEFTIGTQIGTGSTFGIFMTGSQVNYSYSHYEDYGNYGVSFQGQTNVPRTQGWHRVVLAMYPNATGVMMIDGDEVYRYGNMNYSAWDQYIDNPYLNFRAVMVGAECSVGNCVDNNVTTYMDNLSVQTLTSYTWPLLTFNDLFNGTALLIDDNRTNGTTANMTTALNSGPGIRVRLQNKNGVPGFPISHIYGFLNITCGVPGVICNSDQNFNIESFDGANWESILFGAIAYFDLGHSNITIGGQVCTENASYAQTACFDLGMQTVDFLRWGLVNVTMYDADVNATVQSFCVKENGTDVGCAVNGSVVLPIYALGDYNVTVNASGLYDATGIQHVPGKTSVSYQYPVVLGIGALELKYLKLQLNNTINGSLVQSFCAQVNGTSIGCTSNGSITWLDPAPVSNSRSYALFADGSGVYDVAAVVNVSGNATVVMHTISVLGRPVVNASAAYYWKYGGGQITAVFSNVSVTPNATVVALNGSTYAMNVTMTNSTAGIATIPALGVSGPLSYVVNVSEVVYDENVSYQESAVSSSFLVTALQNGGNISPSNGTFYSNTVNISWNPATGGYGSVNYSLFATINGATVPIANTTGTSALLTVSRFSNVTPLLYATDGYATDAVLGGMFKIQGLHALFNVTDYAASQWIQSFCIQINGTGIGCTNNGTLDWVDTIATMNSRDYNVTAYNMSNEYDVSYVMTVVGSQLSTVVTRNVLNVSNVTTNKVAYWSGQDAQVNVTWQDNVYNGSRTLYLDGVTLFAGNSIPMVNLTAGQHTVTVAVQEVVDGVLQYANATSASFVVSRLTHNDNVSPSGVTFYNPQIVYSWLPASGNVSVVTYDVVENLNGTNVTVVMNITGTSVARNVSMPTSNGMVYVKAYDDGYAAQTVANALPFIVHFEYLTVQLNNTVTGLPVQSFCLTSPFSACTVNGSLTWLDWNAVNSTRTYTVSQTNVLGLYNTSRVTQVSGDNATVVLQTRSLLTLTVVATDKMLYWNKTDSNVVTSWVVNADVGTIQSVLYDNNATAATTSVNGFSVGSHNATVSVSEVVEGVNYSVSGSTPNFNVTLLQNGGNISPSAITLSTRYNQNISWNAAAGGLGPVTYTVTLSNGTNTTLASGISDTSFLYNFSAQNAVGGIMVAATDGYVTDTVVGSPFQVVLNAQVLSVSCPVSTLPNEDNMPSQAVLVVNASTYLERQVNESPVVNASNGAVLPGTVNCSQLSWVGDQQAWQCYVPMNYWYNYGNYTTAFRWVNGVNNTQCYYAELLASQRTTSAVYFPNAAPGVVNSSANVPVVIRNTGNAMFNLSMRGFDLAGRSVNVPLTADAFFAGSGLSNAYQMQNNTLVDLMQNVTPGSGAQGNLDLWLTMSAGQVIQEYYTVNPWQVVVHG